MARGAVEVEVWGWRLRAWAQNDAGCAAGRGLLFRESRNYGAVNTEQDPLWPCQERIAICCTFSAQHRSTQSSANMR